MNKTSATTLPLEVLGMFRVIFKSASKHFEEIEKSVGVSGAQLWALSEVANAGGITISNLAKAMSLHQSTTSNLVEKLEVKGFLTRDRSKVDRRVVEVSVTDIGKLALAKAPGPYRGILPDALMQMQTEDLLVLRNSLDGLLQMLERKLPRASGEPLGTGLDQGDRSNK